MIRPTVITVSLTLIRPQLSAHTCFTTNSHLFSFFFFVYVSTWPWIHLINRFLFIFFFIFEYEDKSLPYFCFILLCNGPFVYQCFCSIFFTFFAQNWFVLHVFVPACPTCLSVCLFVMWDVLNQNLPASTFFDHVQRVVLCFGWRKIHKEKTNDFLFNVFKAKIFIGHLFIIISVES